jgi:protein-S-isoprenylcysteine O-methyltransferase Ste14
MMVTTGHRSDAAWTYLALHGSYGLLWLHKDRLFPDRAWEAKATPGSFAVLFALLAHFWVTPWLLVTGPGPSGPAMAVGIGLWAAGMHLLHGADVQKHFVLKERPGLITDGFFAQVRNPNYLGEMLIYAGFACFAAGHELAWVPWALNAWVWTVLFVPSFLAKDARMARHEGWAEWAAQTGWILPRVVERPLSLAAPAAFAPAAFAPVAFAPAALRPVDVDDVRTTTVPPEPIVTDLPPTLAPRRAVDRPAARPQPRPQREPEHAEVG